MIPGRVFYRLEVSWGVLELYLALFEDTLLFLMLVESYMAIRQKCGHLACKFIHLIALTSAVWPNQVIMFAIVV